MEMRGLALPPFAGPPRDPKTYPLVAVNKCITKYVGVGLYDDLTCEPDRGAYIPHQLISVESGQYFQVFMILERTPPTPSWK